MTREYLHINVSADLLLLHSVVHCVLTVFLTAPAAVQLIALRCPGFVHSFADERLVNFVHSLLDRSRVRMHICMLLHVAAL